MCVRIHLVIEKTHYNLTSMHMYEVCNLPLCELLADGNMIVNVPRGSFIA